MQEYMKVDVPVMWPAMCICGAQKGPLVDTFIEKPGYGGRIDPGRIYLCRLCVQRSARALGLVKGAEQERLQEAADELAQAEREIAQRQLLLEAADEAARQQAARQHSLEEQLEALKGELALSIAQLDRIREFTTA